MTQNKKRKQSPVCSDQQQQHDDVHDGKMVDDQENIESMLFDEMTIVNSKLISLGNNFKLVDNLYFMNNNNMIDEFIGNMKQFMKQLELHQKKAAFSKVNSDILSHVYQFLDTETLINCCGLVCKLWRESLIGLKVKVRVENIANFIDSSLANHVTEMMLFDNIKRSVAPFKSLSNSKNLNQLKVLDVSYSNVNAESMEILMKCNTPNLTKLNFYQTDIAEKDAIELFNHSFISTIKKLDLSYATDNFTNNFYESVSESKYLNQITELKVWNSTPQIGKRIDLLLKNKINLERLELCYFDLTNCLNLLINGEFKNLKYLYISHCKIKNQDFANIIVSPNLPNLETMKTDFDRMYWISQSDKTIAVFPPNSQSSITELILNGFQPSLFPSLFDHCPKLRKLRVHPHQSNKEFLQIMKSPGLSNLEYLTISFSEIVEEIFINPIYSNLKELYLGNGEINMDKVKALSNCTNLVNLTTLYLGSFYTYESSFREEFLKLLKNNPTFSKLKHINLPVYDTYE